MKFNGGTTINSSIKLDCWSASHIQKKIDESQAKLCLTFVCFSQAAALLRSGILPPPQGDGCVPYGGLHACALPAACACGTSIATTDDNITAVVNDSITKANDVVLYIIFI